MGIAQRCDTLSIMLRLISGIVPYRCRAGYFAHKKNEGQPMTPALSILAGARAHPAHGAADHDQASCPNRLPTIL